MATKRQIFEPIVKEVLPKRTLLLLSKGMASPLLIGQLIAGYHELQKHPLILLVNFKKEEIPLINAEIKENNFGDFEIHQITNETTQKRSMMYVASGVYSITNVILSMDLLQKALSPSIIAAIIINRAERVQSILDDEAWITTMIRRENKNLKVLAISESIEMIHSSRSFGRMMNALYLEYCSLWPLSRYEILKDVTENSDFETFESLINLPGPLRKIQKTLMNLIRVCIEEINTKYKDRNKGEPVLTENDIFNTSLKLINQKLKGIMTKFSLRYNRIFKDIFEFRSLLYDLVYCDAIEFYLKLMVFKKEASIDSIWYIADQKTMDTLEELLKLARSRVFRIKKEYLTEEEREEALEIENANPNKSQRSSNSSTASCNSNLDERSGLSLISEKSEEKTDFKSNWIKNPIKVGDENYTLDVRLDINFKYKGLVEILKNLSKKSERRIPVWIVVPENRMVEKIKKVINSFFSKKDEHMVHQLHKLKVLLETTRIGAANQAGSVNNTQSSLQNNNPTPPEKNKFQNKPTMKRVSAEKEAKAEDFILDALTRDMIKHKREYEKKMMINFLGFEGANEQSLHEALESLEERHRIEAIVDIDEDPLLQVQYPGDKDQPKLKRNFDDVEKPIDNNLLFFPEQKKTLIRSGEKSDKYEVIDPEKLDHLTFDVLDESGDVFFDPHQIEGLELSVSHANVAYTRLDYIVQQKPEVVILFEPQISLIREIMLMKRCAKYGGRPCSINQVHILMVQNSIESAIYLDTIQRENLAFVSLLKERSSLPQLDDDPESRIKKIIPKKGESTRSGKGAGFFASLSSRPIIIIDKREFNSPLPSRLYHDGFLVIPVLLEKGDYILTNNLVVERKSVETGDLLNSIRSGRLENQLTNMCKTYLRPVLLIEFSEAIDFSLEPAEIGKLQQNANWLNDMSIDKKDINRSNVKFQLSLLAMKFPKLMVIWSKSPEFTSQIFKKLKEDSPDPDLKNFIKFQEEAESKGEAEVVVDEKADNEDDKQALKNILS